MRSSNCVIIDRLRPMRHTLESANDNVLSAEKLEKLLHRYSPGVRLKKRIRQLFDLLAVLSCNPGTTIHIAIQEGTAETR